VSEQVNSPLPEPYIQRDDLEHYMIRCSEQHVEIKRLRADAKTKYQRNIELVAMNSTKLKELKDQIERLLKAGQRLEHAFDQIDCALMSPEQVAEDTKAVGGPVSNYCVDYDEQGVVQRVKAKIEGLRAALQKIYKLQYTGSTLGDARRTAKIALGLNKPPKIKEGEIKR